MEENFLADKPIREEKEDKFQRYNFSKRIAETILNRTSSDSIVIGLYGAWGEGKTSVLNFIKQELKPNSTGVVHFTFNPWRFTDEAALLTSFFNTLANELKNAQIAEVNSNSDMKSNEKKGWKWFNQRKGELKTNTETIGEIIQEYGKIVSIFGAGEAAETIGKAISNVDIEKLKERIEKLLADNKKRIVVFIDDIDRLEKDEIHSIFRLVKLTGDFAYTTYLLSFDENMVSSSIGERFGSGDQKAGLNFLEKIIQIPIKLPLAQSTALKNYCFKLVEQAINSSQISLSEEEGQEFVRKFTSNYLIRLSTPRLAVRYGNTLSFSLPLLKGEVNYVDLLLIEAIRVFYSELYDFIRYQPNYFIGKYDDIYSRNTENEKIKKFKELFDSATKNYSPDEKANAQGVINDLFPNTDKVWGNSWSWGSGTDESRYNQKRISTSQYFNRYFSYTVIEGDISDVAFDSLLNEIANGDFTEKIEPTKKLIQSATPENFIEKIRYREKTFDSNSAIALVKVFSQLGEFFPEKDSFYHWFSPSSQAAIFQAQLIRNQVAEQDKYGLTEWVVENAIPFKQAYETLKHCLNEKDDPKKLFTDEQYKELAGKLIERAKKLSLNKPIWESFSFESKYMLNVWAIDFDKQTLADYIKGYLDSNPNYIVSLLKVFVGIVRSSVYPEPYIGSFEINSYNWLNQVLDANFVYEKVGQVLKIDLSTINQYEDHEHNQTDESLMKQFAYWHNKNKKDKPQDDLISDAEIIE
jgi:predicted KAP-like P-loop ATPase